MADSSSFCSQSSIALRTDRPTIMENSPNFPLLTRIDVRDNAVESSNGSRGSLWNSVTAPVIASGFRSNPPQPPLHRWRIRVLHLEPIGRAAGAVWRAVALGDMPSRHHMPSHTTASERTFIAVLT